MQYFVMKKAKELNCKVLLDGQGGDESLLGYERFYPAFLKGQKFLNKIKILLDSSHNSNLSIKEILLYYIYFTNTKIRIFRLKNRNSFIKKGYLSLISKNLMKSHLKSYFDIIAMQKNELLCMPFPSLLRYADKNSMRHSVETRLPFIDFQTLEAALSFNNQYKIKDGWSKYILRKSVVVDKILPNEVVWRKSKLGFDAPELTWVNLLNDQLSKAIENSKILSEIVYDRSIDLNKLANREKWKFFNITKWEKIYNVSIRQNANETKI